MAEAKNITMKLLVDNTKHRVLFAESGKECVDLVFHFLSLPLAAVVSLVTEESMVGSIGSLYRSFQNLSNDYCLDRENLNRFTDVKIPFMDSDPTDPDYVPDDGDWDMDSEYEYTEPDSDDPDFVKPEFSMFPGGYVNGLGIASYMIMDDLCVEPMSTMSAVMLLKMFDIQDVGQLEERVVTLDTKLAVALLKASLMSKTVLTDKFRWARFASFLVLDRMVESIRGDYDEDETTNRQNQRQSLVCRGGKDGVDFIFHILSLPLGTVVGSMAGSIGNIYGSIESLGADHTQDCFNKTCLLNPKPGPGSATNIPLLTVKPDGSGSRRKIAYKCRNGCGSGYKSITTYFSDCSGVKCPSRNCSEVLGREMSYVIEESRLGYVRSVVTYMITDDLCLKPMSTISTTAILNKTNGLALLKRSLMSKTVLTDVFLPDTLFYFAAPKELSIHP
ncbi:hypothetical protein V2J09_002461 [Rumex salicifolius]